MPGYKHPSAEVQAATLDLVKAAILTYRDAAGSPLNDIRKFVRQHASSRTDILRVVRDAVSSGALVATGGQGNASRRYRLNHPSLGGEGNATVGQPSRADKPAKGTRGKVGKAGKAGKAPKKKAQKKGGKAGRRHSAEPGMKHYMVTRVNNTPLHELNDYVLAEPSAAGGGGGAAAEPRGRRRVRVQHQRARHSQRGAPTSASPPPPPSSPSSSAAPMDAQMSVAAARPVSRAAFESPERSVRLEPAATPQKQKTAKRAVRRNRRRNSCLPADTGAGAGASHMRAAAPMAPVVTVSAPAAAALGRTIDVRACASPSLLDMGRLRLVSPCVSDLSLGRAPSVAASVASRATTPGTTARELEGCVKSLASLLEEHSDL